MKKTPHTEVCGVFYAVLSGGLTLVLILILPVVPNGLYIVVILEVVEQLTHLGYENLSILKVINNMEYRQI